MAACMHEMKIPIDGNVNVFYGMLTNLNVFLGTSRNLSVTRVGWPSVKDIVSPRYEYIKHYRLIFRQINLHH